MSHFTREQLDEINKLSIEQKKELLYICLEDLGIDDVEGARQALCVNRARIYQKMNDNNTLKIGKHKFLMINNL